MHFATGMACTAAGWSALCVMRGGLRGSGWRWLTPAMTLGGLWAIVPDAPRLFREDFPSLGMGATLGAKSVEHFLHRIGDVFFFHRQLDAQPRELALAGLFTIVMLYQGAWLMMWLQRRHGGRHRSRDCLASAHQNRYSDAA